MTASKKKRTTSAPSQSTPQSAKAAPKVDTATPLSTRKAIKKKLSVAKVSPSKKSVTKKKKPTVVKPVTPVGVPKKSRLVKKTARKSPARTTKPNKNPPSAAALAIKSRKKKKSASVKKLPAAKKQISVKKPTRIKAAAAKKMASVLSARSPIPTLLSALSARLDNVTSASISVSSRPLSPSPAAAQKAVSTKKAPSPALPRFSVPPPQAVLLPKRPEPSDQPFVDEYDLPPSYDTTSIALMARDPFWIHAWWELDATTLDIAMKKHGPSASCVLRIYDITGVVFNGTNANVWFDIDLGPTVSNYYIHLWKDNTTYCVDIGLQSMQSSFITLARSNVVTTPRSGASGRTDLIWMEAAPNTAQRPFVIMESKKTAAQRASLPVAQWDTNINPPTFCGPAVYDVRDCVARGPDAFQPPQTSHPPLDTRVVFLGESEMRAYYAQIPAIIGIAPASAVSAPDGAPSEPPLLASAQPFTIEEIILASALVPPGYSCVTAMPDGSRLERIWGATPAASGNRPDGSSELSFGGSGAGASEQSGGASEQLQGNRSFFFELGADLIVYGRTQPDAQVELNGVVIPLRKDGTFTLRFSLPDGTVPLDFIARSPDKIDVRHIATDVHRITRS